MGVAVPSHWMSVHEEATWSKDQQRLAQLSRSATAEVRLAVARNASTPERVIAELTEDPSLDVRRAAAEAAATRELDFSEGSGQATRDTLPSGVAAVSSARTTTLQALPGSRVVQVHGLVTALIGSSGLTAGIKGRVALDMATQNLRADAYQLGANAIVGLTASAFGAAGGLTSVFGGDAVGVLLVGTAVTVEEERDAEAR